MAVDMTDETTTQYTQRIRKMTIEKIKEIIEYLDQPGYNCEGLVTADGVIVPRTKILHQVLSEKSDLRKEKL